MKTNSKNSKLLDKNKIKINLMHNDEVYVITGKDKGKTGKIQKINKKKGKIQIPGINMVKKHRRATQENRTGEIVEIPAFINISNVQIFCPECKKGVRIRIKREDNKKKRLCHRCNYIFGKK
ncbi:MAG: 50S ribosomal protein L24 [Spirochaetota bacterium]|nr:50S ribosomal protein L24 [Spirochaetota bacterium]